MILCRWVLIYAGLIRNHSRCNYYVLHTALVWCEYLGILGVKVKFITRQLLANKIAESWFDQFGNTDDWEDINNFNLQYRSKKKVYELLVGLGDNPCPDKVDEIIGSGSWTRIKCHECGAENVDVFQIGVNPDTNYYESISDNICKDCLTKAVQQHFLDDLLKQVAEEQPEKYMEHVTESMMRDYT